MTTDDPRLTAYVLGELSAPERAEVEALLERSEEARREVREIRETAELLAAELGAEAPKLTPAQRAAIATRAARPRATAARPWMRIAAAAGLLGIVGWWIAQDPPRLMGGTVEERSSETDTTPFAYDMGEAAGPAPAVALEVPQGPSPSDPDGFDRRSRNDAERSLSEPFANGRPDASPPARTGLDAASVDAAKVEPLRQLGYSAAASDRAAGNFARAGDPRAESSEMHRGLGYIEGGGAEHAAPAGAPGPAAEPGSGATGAGLLSGRGRKTAAGAATSAPSAPAEDRGLHWPTPTPAPHVAPGAEAYAPIADNEFVDPWSAPLSTFGIDVDTGAYSNVRRFLEAGSLPPADAVRIEELVNYFRYDYDAPSAAAVEAGEPPFAVDARLASCPWQPDHHLLRIGLAAMEVDDAARPPANLVFLIDVSGSMSSADKLPLLKTSMRLMVQHLRADDRVALVTYAGSSGIALDSTSCAESSKILAALDALSSGGSTNGGAGIQLAYDTARRHFVEGGVNRVVLATDGDFNVGITDRAALERLITDSARSGVFLSVLGFGTGNLKDSTVEMLADKGNGHYAYIDSLDEGRRVLVEQIAGTLVTVAKDVKVQVEFNPAHVGAYRLIGYENRALAARDFNDDRKDAGEVGAGHVVTALYQIAPPGASFPPGVDELKYQQQPAAPEPPRELVESPELCTVKLRYKQPDGETSALLSFPVLDEVTPLAEADDDLRFAAAVAAFGMILRDSPHRGAADCELVLELARAARGADERGYRAEFIRLVEIAAALSAR